MKEIFAILAFRQSHPAEGAILVTLVRVAGSSYRRAGARMLIKADGTRIGSISGGCLEEDVILRARQVLATGIPETITYDTTSENDLIWGVGLGCHGIVDVLLEKLPPHLTEWETTLLKQLHARIPTSLEVVYTHADFRQLGTRLETGRGSTDTNAAAFVQSVESPTPLVIFGAGDDAQPLARMANELGWEVTVADPRSAFATHARFPAAFRVVVLKPGHAGFNLADLPLHARSLAVVMTHHYVHDKPLLGQLLPMPLVYLGLLGPKKRATKILEDLAADGLQITPEMSAKLHGPVGLDLGADTPEEVALSILAEMQATLAGRTGTPLRERLLPIHE